MEFVILAVVVAGSATYALWAHRPSRQYLLDREVDPGQWSRLYPREDMPAVQQALAAITSAFLLKDEDADRLRPDDRLIEIYRAAYPVRDTPDALEFETLWSDMRDKLRATEAELCGLTDMTVQDIVSMWIAKRESRRTSRCSGRARE